MKSASRIYKPVVAEIEMTHQCNLRCPSCAIIDDINKAKYRLTENQILDFLYQAEENKITVYSLTGGEPFLNFKLLENILRKSPISLLKINTNGFVFSTRKETKRILLKLKRAGFALQNKDFRSGLNISIGQQTAQGVPLENSIYALHYFYTIFPKEKAGISLNVFSTNLEYSIFIIDEFKRLYKRINGQEFDSREFPIKLIPPDGRKCLTVNLGPLIKKEMAINNLINYYLYKGGAVLNCSSKKKLSRNNFLAPRLLLRADGSVYSCLGFSYVHKLGNIHSQSLKNMLYLANKNIIIKTVFKEGLEGLLKLAEKCKPGIGKEKISTANGLCDICRILKKFIIISCKINKY